MSRAFEEFIDRHLHFSDDEIHGAKCAFLAIESEMATLTADIATARAEAAAVLEKAATHMLFQNNEDFAFCSCGWEANTNMDRVIQQRWTAHLLTLATQPQRDALAEVVRRAKLEEAEWWECIVGLKHSRDGVEDCQPDCPYCERLAQLRAAPTGSTSTRNEVKDVVVYPKCVTCMDTGRIQSPNPMFTRPCPDCEAVQPKGTKD